MVKPRTTGVRADAATDTNSRSTGLEEYKPGQAQSANGANSPSTGPGESKLISRAQSAIDEYSPSTGLGEYHLPIHQAEPKIRVLAPASANLTRNRLLIDGFQDPNVTGACEHDLSDPKRTAEVFQDLIESSPKFLWYAPGTSQAYLELSGSIVKACHLQNEKGNFYFISVPASTVLLPLEELALNTGGVFVRFSCCGLTPPAFTQQPQVLLTNVPVAHLTRLMGAQCHHQRHGEDTDASFNDEGREAFSEGYVKAMVEIMVRAKDDNPTYHKQLTVNGEMTVAILNVVSRANRNHTDTACDSGAEISTVTEGKWRFTAVTSREVNLTGFAKDPKRAILSPIGSACAVMYDINNNKVLVTLNETALQTNDQLACLIDPYQLRHNGWKVHDSMELEDGHPRIVKGGISIPLTEKGSLYFRTYYPTDEEMDTLPRVDLTSSEPNWSRQKFMDGRMNRLNSHRSGNLVPEAAVQLVRAKTLTTELQPRIFSFLSPEVRKMTSKATTQLQHTNLLTNSDVSKNYKPNLALSATRNNELLSTDTLYSKVQSKEGLKMGQVFVYTTSKYLFAYPFRLRTEMTTAITACILANGIPVELRSDNAKEISSAKIAELLRGFFIKQSFSEPHHQNQDPTERWIGYLIRRVVTLLEQSGAPPEEWWAALLYAIYVHNRTANRNLGWRTPIEVKDGETPDISDINQFSFYQPVLYKSTPSKSSFPLPRMEEGRYLRPAANTGGVFASVIRQSNGREIYRSQLRAVPAERQPLSQTKQEELQRSRSDLFDAEVLARATPFESEAGMTAIAESQEEDEQEQEAVQALEEDQEERSSDEGCQQVSEPETYEYDPPFQTSQKLQEEQYLPKPPVYDFQRPVDDEGTEEEPVKEGQETDGVGNDPDNPWLTEDDSTEEEEFSILGREIGRSIWIRRLDDKEQVVNGKVSRDFLNRDGNRTITIEFRGVEPQEDRTMSYAEYLTGIVEPDQSEDAFSISRIKRARQVKVGKSYIWQVFVVFSNSTTDWIDWEHVRDDDPLQLARFVLALKPKEDIPKKYLKEQQE